VLNISCDTRAAAEAATRLVAAHDAEAPLEGISEAGYSLRPSA
jgi:hypothetical protein